MSKSLILSIIACLSGCGITVPYFDNLDPKYVCGDYPSPYCQPNSSTKWTPIKSGVDYDGDPNHYLGRSFFKYFQRDQCISSNITDSDVVISGKQNVNGVLNDNEKTEFSNKLSADIVALIETNGVPVPPGVKADVSTEVAKKIDNTDKSTIELEYKRIDLNMDFMDEHLASCIAKTPKNEKVATGISVITVSGKWSSDRVSETMASIEASASYSVLSDQAKAEYQQAKQRVLNGTFEPVAFVFAVAYRKGQL
jgi:hypothetical protein